MNFFNTLIAKWSESLSFFKKDNFKLFLLASLNSTFKSLILFFKKFWVLPVLFLLAIASLSGLNILFFKLISNKMLFIFLNFLMILLSIGALVLALQVVFLPFLLVRASSENKNFNYLRKNIKKILTLSILVIVLFLFPPIVFKMPLISISSNIILKIWMAFAGTVFCFTTFFFLDTKKHFITIFISFVRALKLFVFFMPVMLFLIIFFLSVTFLNMQYGLLQTYLLQNGFMFLFYLASAFFFIFSFILTFLNLSFIANYYTIVRHKYYSFFL